METTIYELGQYSITAPALIAALNLPAGTTFQNAIWDGVAQQATITAVAYQNQTSPSNGVTLNTYELGQFVLSAASIASALNLPAGAVIQSVSWSPENGQPETGSLFVVAQTQQSQSGTP